MKEKLFWLVVCVALLDGTSVRATTYSVDNTPGNVLGVTGFITTNGNTGVLDSGDFLDWSLTIPATAGGVAFTLDKNNSSVGLDSNLVSATSTALLFNFSGSSTLSSFSFQDGSYSVSWFTGFFFSNVLGGNEEIGDGSCSLCFLNSPPFFGTEIIGTAPLPGALPLFGSGLGILSLLYWRRNRNIC